MYSATAFNHAYNDTGLFCISASAPPEQLNETAQVVYFLGHCFWFYEAIINFEYLLLAPSIFDKLIDI